MFILAHGILPCGQELPLIGMALSAIPLGIMWLRRVWQSFKAKTVKGT
jgi:hypothetical protein